LRAVTSRGAIDDERIGIGDERGHSGIVPCGDAFPLGYFRDLSFAGATEELRQSIEGRAARFVTP
jgi:hypothetical protein